MRLRSGIGGALAVFGASLLAAACFAVLDAMSTQAELAARLADLDRPGERGTIETASATRKEASERGLVGRIELPRVGLDAVVVEGAGGRALSRGVGHVPSTAFPGEPGNTALAGHRDTFFRSLEHVREGDVVRLDTPDGRFSYRAESILVVDPDRGDLLSPTSRPTLTLVTCYPFTWVGPAPHRLVVRAVAD